MRVLSSFVAYMTDPGEPPLPGEWVMDENLIVDQPGMSVAYELHLGRRKWYAPWKRRWVVSAFLVHNDRPVRALRGKWVRSV